MNANQGWQRKSVTLNFAQAAGSYALLTVAGGDVILNPAMCAYYVDAVGATFTSIAIQTDTAHPTILLTATEGAVANLVAGICLDPAWKRPVLLKSGQSVVMVIVGATGTGSGTMSFEWKPTTVGGGYV